MAPEKISLTADGWTTDTTKASFLGTMAHWIEVKGQTWKLRSEVVGFKPISGDHSGCSVAATRLKVNLKAEVSHVLVQVTLHFLM